jgi:hypothetical protein
VFLKRDLKWSAHWQRAVQAASTPRAADAATAPYTMAQDSSQLTTGAAAPEPAAKPLASPAAAHGSQQADPAPQQPVVSPAGSDGGGGSRAEAAAASPAQPAVSSAAEGPTAGAAPAAGGTDADDATAGPQPDPQSSELLGRAAWVFSRAAAQEAGAEVTRYMQADPPLLDCHLPTRSCTSITNKQQVTHSLTLYSILERGAVADEIRLALLR